MEGFNRNNLVLGDVVDHLVMPGDRFVSPFGENQVILGPGLKLLPGDRIVACRAGILRKAKSNSYYVDLKNKQYESFKKDDVLGIIKQKGKGDHYSCDVGTRERAQLSKFAFEGATKRFRPDLQVGDVVYGKVLDLPPDYPMEITCVNGSGKAQGMGLLEGGHITQLPVHFTRILRTPSEADNLLRKIGKIVPCETAVGVNGMVWVKAKNAVLTILVLQLLVRLSKVSHSEYDKLIKAFRKGIGELPQ